MHTPVTEGAEKGSAENSAGNRKIIPFAAVEKMAVNAENPRVSAGFENWQSSCEWKINFCREFDKRKIVVYNGGMKREYKEKNSTTYLLTLYAYFVARSMIRTFSDDDDKQGFGEAVQEALGQAGIGLLSLETESNAAYVSISIPPDMAPEIAVMKVKAAFTAEAPTYLTKCRNRQRLWTRKALISTEPITQLSRRQYLKKQKEEFQKEKTGEGIRRNNPADTGRWVFSGGDIQSDHIGNELE